MNCCSKTLKSCPFCGGRASLINDTYGQKCVIECDSCGVTMIREYNAHYSALNKVTTAWNRRDEEDSQ